MRTVLPPSHLAYRNSLKPRTDSNVTLLIKGCLSYSVAAELKKLGMHRSVLVWHVLFRGVPTIWESGVRRLSTWWCRPTACRLLPCSNGPVTRVAASNFHLGSLSSSPVLVRQFCSLFDVLQRLFHRACASRDQEASVTNDRQVHYRQFP